MSDIAGALKDAAQSEIRHASNADNVTRPWSPSVFASDSCNSPGGRPGYDANVSAECKQQLRAVSGAALAAVSEAAEILSEGARVERRQQQRQLYHSTGEVAVAASQRDARNAALATDVHLASEELQWLSTMNHR